MSFQYSQQLLLTLHDVKDLLHRSSHVLLLLVPVTPVSTFTLAAAACAAWHNVLTFTSQQLPPASLQMCWAGCFSSPVHLLLLPFEMDDWLRTCP